MISLLYKRYALVFFLLWILAALSLAVAVLLSDAAMSGLLLFLALLLLALGIFVKVLDALRLQQQFDGLLRQGRNVKEQELSRMGALALRKELNIRRLQLIGLSAFADQRGAQRGVVAGDGTAGKWPQRKQKRAAVCTAAAVGDGIAQTADGTGAGCSWPLCESGCTVDRAVCTDPGLCKGSFAFGAVCHGCPDRGDRCAVCPPVCRARPGFTASSAAATAGPFGCGTAVAGLTARRCPFTGRSVSKRMEGGEGRCWIV